MDDILTKVQEAFNQAFDIDQQLINIDTGPDKVKGWDSMGHVSLVSSLEETFNVSFDIDDVMEMENVREIVRIVKSRICN